MAQHVYFGTWVWRALPVGDEAWVPPVSNIPFGAFDLRSRAACASPGLSTGHGIFVYPQLVSDPLLNYLGERGAGVGTPRKTAIKTLLGLGENIVADNVGDMVAELLLQHAEPEWDLRWGRIRGRPWSLSCLGEVWKQYRMADADPEWLLVLQALRANYQRLKAEVAAGRLPPLFHRRFLRYQLDQYRIRNFEDITQDAGESPLPHGTSWTESWPTANTTISSGQSQVWTEVANDVDVNSLVSVNRLNNITLDVNCRARCETVLAGDAHYCQGTVHCAGAVAEARAAPATRYQSDAVTAYEAIFWWELLHVPYDFRKVVTGTLTSLATAGSGQPNVDTDFVVRLTSRGNDTHTMTVDSVDVILNHSNADITGNVRGGALLRSIDTAGQANIGPMSAADLVALPLMGGNLHGGLLLHGQLVRG